MACHTIVETRIPTRVGPTEIFIDFVVGAGDKRTSQWVAGDGRLVLFVSWEIVHVSLQASRRGDHVGLTVGDQCRPTLSTASQRLEQDETGSGRQDDKRKQAVFAQGSLPWFKLRLLAEV